MHSARAPAAYDPIVAVRVEWVRYGREAPRRRCGPTIAGDQGRRAAGAGHRRGAVQPRRRGHPAAAVLGLARARQPRRASGWPRSPSSPPTGWPSCSAPPRLAGQGRRPVSTPVLAAARAGRAGRATRACSRRSPSTPPPSRRSSPPTASCATSRPAALDALAGRERPRPRRSCASTGPPGPGSSRAGTTRKTCSPPPPSARRRAGGRRARGGRRPPAPAPLPAQRAACSRRSAEHVPTTVVAGHHRACPRPTPRWSTSLRRLGDRRPTAPSRSAIPRRSPPTARVVVTASDGDEEVRAAVRAVVDAVRAGTRLDRIAVLHAAPEPYARLAHEQLHAAGIATNGAAVVPLAGAGGRPHAARAARPPRRRLPAPGRVRLAVVGADPPRRPAGAHHRVGAAVPRGRRWSPVATTGTTASRSSRDATSSTPPRPSSTTTSPSGVPSRLRADAERARASSAAFVLGLIDDLAAAAARPRRWSEHAAWAAALARAAPRRRGPPRALGRRRRSARRPSGSTRR